MPNFESGVQGYIRTTATVTVNFPVDAKVRADICCLRCPYLSSNERMCQLNKEPVAYPKTYVGDMCPLERIIDEGEEF